MKNATLFWIGMSIMLITHLYLLFKESMSAKETKYHALINLVAYGLMVGGM